MATGRRDSASAHWLWFPNCVYIPFVVSKHHLPPSLPWTQVYLAEEVLQRDVIRVDNHLSAMQVAAPVLARVNDSQHFLVMSRPTCLRSSQLA
jgi:hypothetical protein